MKEIFKVKGVIESVGDLIQMKKNKKNNFFKKVLTVKTADGQILYVDILNSRLKSLEDQNIQENSIVEIDFTFKGSEKDGKKYNNIFCNNIKPL